MASQAKSSMISSNLVQQLLVPEIIMVQSSGLSAIAERVHEARAGAHEGESNRAVFLVDDFFDSVSTASGMGAEQGDLVISVSTVEEPSTGSVDAFAAQARELDEHLPSVVVGFGGGTT